MSMTLFLDMLSLAIANDGTECAAARCVDTECRDADVAIQSVALLNVAMQMLAYRVSRYLILRRYRMLWRAGIKRSSGGDESSASILYYNILYAPQYHNDPLRVTPNNGNYDKSKNPNL